MIQTEGRPEKRKKLTGSLSAIWAADPSLLTQCNQIVAWIACNDSLDSPFNRAEADRMSEAETNAAFQEQLAIMCHVEKLQWEIIKKHATSEAEVEAKIQVLNTLSGIASWDQDSLRELRISIEQDQMAINRRLSARKAQRRPSWFHRIGSFSW